MILACGTTERNSDGVAMAETSDNDVVVLGKRTLEDAAEPKAKRRKASKKSYRGLEVIISGGQYGADRGALVAAERLGIKTGGVAPVNFLTSQGPCPELGTRFGLSELKCGATWDPPPGAQYIMRSKRNVDGSDGTVAFRTHSSRGTDCTIGYCLAGKWKALSKEEQGCVAKPMSVVKLTTAPDGTWVVARDLDSTRVSRPRKPLLVIRSVHEDDHRASWSAAKEELIGFLKKHSIQVLNVAGHRSNRVDSAWEKAVTAFLEYALKDHVG